jgi:hypothetical protein
VVTEEQQKEVMAILYKMPFSGGARFRWDEGEDFGANLIANLERLTVEIEQYVEDDVKPLREEAQEYRRVLRVLGTVFKRVQEG